MNPTPPRLTIQEMQNLLASTTVAPLTPNAGFINSVLASGLRALKGKPQVFDFGRTPALPMSDRKFAAQLWHRKLLRPPFPITIFTYFTGHARLTILIIDDATIIVDGNEEMQGCTGALLISQPLVEAEPTPGTFLARVDAFTWFRVTNEENIQTGASVITECEGETDETFRGYTLSGVAKVMDLSMLLNTKGIPKRSEPVPVKLNQKRARSGKPPLDAVTYVDLSRLTTTSNHPGSSAGHGKSMHLRRGHIRHYDDGSVTWVRDAIIKAEGQLKERARYQVRP